MAQIQPTQCHIVQLKDDEERIEDEEAENRKKLKSMREHHKNWEANRDGRVGTWRTFVDKKSKKKVGCMCSCQANLLKACWVYSSRKGISGWYDAESVTKRSHIMASWEFFLVSSLFLQSPDMSLHLTGDLDCCVSWPASAAAIHHDIVAILHAYGIAAFYQMHGHLAASLRWCVCMLMCILAEACSIREVQVLVCSFG